MLGSGGHGQHVVKRTGQGHGDRYDCRSRYNDPAGRTHQLTHALIRYGFLVDRDGHDDAEHQRHGNSYELRCDGLNYRDDVIHVDFQHGDSFLGFSVPMPSATVRTA